MAQLLLGSRVTMRPGTHLIKIQSHDDVFAVEPGGVRRLVPDEAIAERLYGVDWADRVVDVPVTFFHDYRLGTELGDTYPDGTVVRIGPDALYVQEGIAREISALGRARHRFQERFEVNAPVLALPFGARIIEFEESIGRIFSLTQ